MTAPEAPADHRAMAEALRRRVGGAPGRLDPALRRAAAARAAGGPPMAQPFDDLARQIGEAVHRVTDNEVARVREAAGSDKAAFELVMAAAVGAGLERWDCAMRALAEAGDASE